MLSVDAIDVLTVSTTQDILLMANLEYIGPKALKVVSSPLVH